MVMVTPGSCFDHCYVTLSVLITMVTGLSAWARHLLASHISISSFLHRGQDTEHCLILIHCTTGVTLLPVSPEILTMLHIYFIRLIQPKQKQKLEREVNI